MAQSESARTVVVTKNAAADLYAIRDWNAKHYGSDHADRYLAFLEQEIFGLDRSHSRGKTIGTRPNIQYRLVRRASTGYGHLVVYRLQPATVVVLHVFHTAQDWQSKIANLPDC